MSRSQASTLNYYERVLNGTARFQRDKVMRSILWHHPKQLTRHQLSKITGIPIQSICSAVYSLVKSECIEETGDLIPDPITTNPARKLKCTQDPPAQRSFTWAS